MGKHHRICTQCSQDKMVAEDKGHSYGGKGYVCGKCNFISAQSLMNRLPLPNWGISK